MESASTIAATIRIHGSEILNIVATPVAAANYNPAVAVPSAPRELTISADLAGLRLDQALARLMPEHSRSRIKSWIDAGRVSVTGRAAAVRTATVRSVRL